MKQEWISVNDRLPEIGPDGDSERVLMFDKYVQRIGRLVRLPKRGNLVWKDDSGVNREVTYWRALLEDPSGK